MEANATVDNALTSRFKKTNFNEIVNDGTFYTYKYIIYTVL